jgi:hypothetical protein
LQFGSRIRLSGGPRQGADLPGQWREKLLALI